MDFLLFSWKFLLWFDAELLLDPPSAWEKTHEGNSSGLAVVAMERRGQWSRLWLSSAAKSKTAGLLSGWMLVVWLKSLSSLFFASPDRNRKVPKASQSDRARELEISHKLPPHSKEQDKRVHSSWVSISFKLAATIATLCTIIFNLLFFHTARRKRTIFKSWLFVTWGLVCGLPHI